MEVREIMEKTVKTCGPETTLATVAHAMWDGNVGCLPVVDPAGKPLGVVTDRDIAMSCYLNQRALWELRAGEVIAGKKVWTCFSDDPLETAIGIMEEHGVRRLPVIDRKGHLKGILSLGDMVATAEVGTSRKKPELPFSSLAPALKACFSHHTVASA